MKRIDFGGVNTESGAIWDQDTAELNLKSVELEEIAEVENSLAHS